MNFSDPESRKKFLSREEFLGIVKGVTLASEAITAALVISVPPLLGFWLDTQAATLPVFLVLGFMFGGVGGWAYFVALLRPVKSEQNRETNRGQGEEKRQKNAGAES